MKENSLKGSQWNKWDLHIHTPASFFWKGGKNLLEMSDTDKDSEMERFINTINESDVVSFSLMDYWTFDWYIELRKYLEKNPGKLKKKIFPGMELRIECPVDYRLNIHVLLSDSLSTQQLNDFKHGLKIRIGTSVKNLSNEALMELAKSFDKSKAKVHGFGDPKSLPNEELLKLGSMTAEVTRESLTGEGGAFSHIPKGTGFIILPYNTSDGLVNLDWSTHPQADNYFMQSADFFEARDQKTIDLISGVKNSENESFFDNFFITLGNESKPCLSGSDAHSYSDYGKYPSNKVTWIKSDLTFNGLKQVLCEPESRVRIQERNPDESKSGRIVIDRVTYKDESGSVKEVEFSKDLNSIIGKRGGGKSTLLKNIAYTVDKDQFEKRGSKNPYHLNDFEVIWGDNVRNSGTIDSPKSIFYIPQNYLSSLSYEEGEENTSERDDFLVSLLKKSLKFSNAISQLEGFNSSNRIQIEGLIQNVLSNHQSITESQNTSKKLGSQSEITKEILAKKEKISEYKKDNVTNLTEKEIEDYSLLKKTTEENRKTLLVLKQDKEILEGLKNEGASIFISDQKFNMLSLQRRQSLTTDLNSKSKDELSRLIESEIKSIELLFKATTENVKEGEEKYLLLDEKIKKSKVMSDLTKELADLEKTSERITSNNTLLDKSKKDFDSNLDKLVSAYLEYEGYQDAIYKTVTFENDFQFLKINIKSRSNLESLKAYVEKYVNTRDSELRKNKEVLNLFGGNPSIPTKDLVREFVLGLINGEVKIKVGAGDKAESISQFLKNRFEIDFMNSVTTGDGLTLFKDMTGGQKAIVFLELIFCFDDEMYPILIDQPEDDLDVVGVATDLVNFVRTQKNKRQIIIVTHNASLLVCADSESIVTSESQRVSQGKLDFSYHTGSIENPGSRANIIKILEGGEDALERRMKKLGIHS